MLTLGHKNYDLNKLNQMSYKSYLSNNIFDTQSHVKMTAAFIVNKLFFYYNKSDLYIHKTYILLLKETFANTCFLYFDIKPVLEDSQGSSGARASFLLKMHEK